MNRNGLSALIVVGIFWIVPAYAITLHTTDDATIDLNKPNKNEGDKKDLEVRNTGAGGEHQVFVRFDLSPLPSDATVDKAVLRLWTNKVKDDGGLDLHVVMEAWDETRLTSGTVLLLFPAFVTGVPITGAEEDHFVTIDVTSQVQDWLTEGVGNFGLALIGNGADDVRIELDAKENTSSSHAMELEVALVGGGTPGPQGPQGETGPPGSPGLPGEDGETGPQGETGPAGPPGPIGPQGEQGANGAQGPQGVAGPTGPAGPQGNDGLPGAQGQAGSDGIPGLDGSKWLTGTGLPNSGDGVLGDFYLDEASGDYYKKTGGTTWNIAGNLQGPQGIQGLPGADGVDGNDGPQGPEGSPGPQGIQGVAGVDGVDGNDGAPGPPGPQGIQGLAGVDGNDGAQGIPGPAGPQGVAGPPGPVNPNGFAQDGNSFGALATLGTNDNNPLAFEINGNERMRINSFGRLELGTNSNPIPRSAVTLDTNVSAGNAIHLFRSGGGLSAVYFRETSSGVDQKIWSILAGGPSFNIITTQDNGLPLTTALNINRNTNQVTLAGNLSAPRLFSTVVSGTAPFNVTSNTLVANLNADLLDEQQGSFYLDASNLNAGTLNAAVSTDVVVVDGSGNLGINAGLTGAAGPTGPPGPAGADGADGVDGNDGAQGPQGDPGPPGPQGPPGVVSFPTRNTQGGDGALANNTTGSINTAFGWNALNANTGGSTNTAFGAGALGVNTTGAGNSATGVSALQNNTSGSNNTASGVSALQSNTSGISNTASGFDALRTNTFGGGNTASGVSALRSNTSGLNNTAIGLNALLDNTSGSQNTASGIGALSNNTIGESNTSSGWNALFSNRTGSRNIAFGLSSGASQTTGSDNIYIGNTGTAGENGRIKIGNSGTHTATFIAGISGVNVAGTTVVVDGSGQLGIPVSSRRFKENIHDMGETSSALLQLRPVTYNYKKQYANGKQTLEYGLIAEEVAEVYPHLVVYDADGQVQTVQYRKLITMLLNELQKNHRVIQTQQKQIATHDMDLQDVATQLQELRQHNAMLVEQVNTLSTFLEGLRLEIATVRQVNLPVE